MEKKLVYDLPTRLFHILFAGLFLTAFVIAKTVDDESAIYAYHMLAGILMVGLVLFRVFWGIVGTKHARFSNFALSPKDLVAYFKGFLSGEKRRWAGHNPASSWAAIIMMALAVGLGITGYLMVSGTNKETFEDLHELFANGFMVVVVLHLAGIVLHSIRHHEMIGFSMLDGKKVDITPEQTIPSSRPVVGVLFAGLVCVLGLHVFTHYNNQTGRLDLFGTTLQLTELEDEGGSSAENSEQDDDDDDDDEDED